MDDLISRKAALDAIDGMKPMQGSFEQLAMKALCWAAVKTIQPVDAVPVVHGRWITNKHGETVCSECDNNALQVLTGCLVNRHFEPHKSEFCPNCGARMDGDA